MRSIKNTEELREWAKKSIKNSEEYVVRRGQAMYRMSLYNQIKISKGMNTTTDLNMFYPTTKSLRLW